MYFFPDHPVDKHSSLSTDLNSKHGSAWAQGEQDDPHLIISGKQASLQELSHESKNWHERAFKCKFARWQSRQQRRTGQLVLSTLETQTNYDKERE
jgi:hypothetical protein